MLRFDLLLFFLSNRNLVSIFFVINNEGGLLLFLNLLRLCLLALLQKLVQVLLNILLGLKVLHVLSHLTALGRELLLHLLDKAR